MLSRSALIGMFDRLIFRRSTKGAIKHKILPDEPSSLPQAEPKEEQHPDLEWDDDADVDSENMAGLHNIPEGNMRRDALRLTRKARSRLPRVTAYSTATYVLVDSYRSYKLPELIRWLQARSQSHETNVLRFDECVYTTYTYQHVDEARGLPSTAPWILHQCRPPFRWEESAPKTGDLLGIPELNNDTTSSSEHGLQTISEEGEDDGNRQAALATPRPSTTRKSAMEKYVPEVFFMEYGSAYSELMISCGHLGHVTDRREATASGDPPV